MGKNQERGVRKMKRRPLVRMRFLVMGVLALAVYFGSPFRLSVVHGASMEPTLREGDIWLVDRTYYAHHPLVKGEILCFRHGDRMLTKRVYGVPGETLILIHYTDDGTYEIPTPSELKANLRFDKPGAIATFIHLKLRDD